MRKYLANVNMVTINHQYEVAYRLSNAVESKHRWAWWSWNSTCGIYRYLHN